MGSGNKKRLDIYDRMNIQAMLETGKTLSAIARAVGCSKSTVWREVRNNSRHEGGGSAPGCIPLSKRHVCNRCHMAWGCNRPKLYYDYREAEYASGQRMSVARQVPKTSADDIKAVSDIVALGVKRGQSLHHIYRSSPGLRKICSEETVRRLCYARRLETKPHELRMYVVYKHSYQRPLTPLRIDKMEHIIGRTYKDFLEFTSRHKRAEIVQFDSVIGTRNDERAILTVTWKETDFQVGLIIKKDDPTCAHKAIKGLMERFTPEERKALFGALLADNGLEFSTFWKIDQEFPGCRCFYARPYRSTDKAECERNHRYIRYVHAKGKTLDGMTQPDADEMLSNINSYVRKGKGDRTPYQLMERKFGRETMSKFDIRKIPLKKVDLSAK